MQHYIPPEARFVHVKLTEQQIFSLPVFYQYRQYPATESQMRYSIELACIY